MTVLQALDRYYDRLPDAVRPGWSREKFGWCLVLDAAGGVVDTLDLRDLDGKKPRPKQYVVPAGVKRTAGIAPNLLWDKTSYVLGRTAGAGKRTAQEHAAFVALHRERLADTQDEGLLALLRFLNGWTPEHFETLRHHADMLDENVLFRLDGDRSYLHERPAARALVEVEDEAADCGDEVLCLVSGERDAPARLHPTVKGVEGAQSSGASLVSFNLDAFESYGQKQGANAPTGAAAAFRYGAALNRLLTRDGPNRVRRPIGDATTIFWADASDVGAAEAAEALIALGISPDVTDEAEAAKLSEQLEQVARGAPVATIHPGLVDGTRMYVLGLAPNAARLSVRYWITDPLEKCAERLQRHRDDLAIEPRPHQWGAGPSVNLLLARTTALMGKFDNIPPLLAGEVMRAVLAGTPYPLTLMSAALTRLRAGDDPGGGWHAALIRAVLVRQARARRGPDPDEETRRARDQEEVPVSLNRDHPDPGYQLGRLFAAFESAQRAALGFNINATIRDKYFGAASATPAGVFPLLMKNGQNHLAKVRKEKPGLAVVIERELDEIIGRLEPDLPRSLGLRSQGGFAIGYYHQRQAQYAKSELKEIGDVEQKGESDDE